MNSSLKKELLFDLKKIITSKPKELKQLNQKYLKLFPKKILKGKLQNDNRILYIFNYKEFRRKYGFSLSKKINIECCPYCNKNYTTSLQTNLQSNKIKNVYPEFDHFYPQMDYPFLTLSFYNLIPSCNICNTHFKSKKDPSNLFHPYTKINSNLFNFKSFPNEVSTLYGAKNNLTLDFDYIDDDDEINEKIKNSLEFFGIKDIYEKCHTNLIEEIIYKRLAFSDRYIKELQVTYKISFEDAYRILFETYFEDDKHYKRPFSKLKKDIYESLK